MINIHKLTLNIMGKNLKPRLYITQNDINSNTIQATILQEKNIFDLTGITAELICLKPSGKYTLNMMKIVENKLEFTLTQQEVVEYGRVECSIQLYSGQGARVSTMKFDVDIASELVASSVIDSEIRVSNVLLYLIEDLETLRLELKGLSIDGIQAELDAVTVTVGLVDDKVNGFGLQLTNLDTKVNGIGDFTNAVNTKANNIGTALEELTTVVETKRSKGDILESELAPEVKTKLNNGGWTLTDKNTTTGIVGTIEMWTGTQMEYDLLVTKADNVLYIVR